jgi:hypothetical protein
VPVEVFAFPQYREEAEAHLAQNPNPRLRVHWVTLRRPDPWRPDRGERGLRLHYVLWPGEASRAVRARAVEAGRDISSFTQTESILH